MFDSTKKKVLVVGDGNCGKTSLLIRFTKDLFVEQFYDTIHGTMYGTMYVYDVGEISVDSESVQLRLCDAPAFEDFDELRASTYSETDVALICFGINSISSFENITTKWYPEVRQFCPSVPIVLVGNKKDLRDGIETADNEYIVKYEEGKALADEIGAVAYVECSSKNNDGVFEVFDTVTKVSMQDNMLNNLLKCHLL